jgi:hypothetical protein
MGGDRRPTFYGVQMFGNTHPVTEGNILAPTSDVGLIKNDQKVSVYLIITIRKVTGNVQNVPHRPSGPGGQ